MTTFHLSTFKCDVTPPEGHPLCGGWIEPVRAVDDPLQALGVILLGMGKPIVLGAVDWCGLRNEAHWVWRDALARAAHTTPECVALHCVHQHNAPFADVEAERLVAANPGAPASLDLKFFERVVRQTSETAQASLAHTRAFNHIGIGKARVEQVASNRRVLGEDGKVKFVRYSATKDAKVRAEPEGLIDPWLKTLSFWMDAKPQAALHYYATHPMSYYGDGRVSSDFCGLARKKRQQDHRDVFQIYFTGCAGNITAGKYNDGAKENRPVLRDRIYDALTAAWKATERFPLKSMDWRIEAVKLPPRTEKSFSEEASRQALENPKESKAKRNNAAFQLAWLKRINRPIEITCLDLGKAAVVHLPGEPFVEYQHDAQKFRPDVFVCVAGYGDGGPGYIPTASAYLQGGYEPTVALAGPESELMLHRAMRKVLGATE
ncbi:MAG TPA: hypothetical protein VGX70_17515 [Gemmataceae bacterium]|jgi:hypothetical protein|nr:hypothetical protein [Gemmataceae bacterium]